MYTFPLVYLISVLMRFSLLRFFLEIRINFVFFIFIVNPYSSLQSITLFTNYCRSSIFSARITVSSAYFILLIGVPFIFIPAVSPSKAFCKITSEYALKSIGDKRHPCLTLLLISIFFMIVCQCILSPFDYNKGLI